MADYPYLPLWTDAYLADTTHLSEVEHGRYLLMLMHLWRMPDKRFPNDNQWLARKFGRSVEAIETDYRPLIVEFLATDGNWIFSRRLKREWLRVRRTTKRQSENAKARWQKEKDECHGNAGSAKHPEPEPQPYIKNITPLPAGGTPFAPNGAHGPPAPKPASQKGQGSRLDPEWTPGDEGVEYARRFNFDDDRINRMFDDFRDCFLAKAGQAARKVDWPRTWKRWVKTEHDRIREREDRERRFQEQRRRA